MISMKLPAESAAGPCAGDSAPHDGSPATTTETPCIWCHLVSAGQPHGLEGQACRNCFVQQSPLMAVQPCCAARREGLADAGFLLLLSVCVCVSGGV